ncbi:MAG: Gfo/Idh/MocA family oxidoreductase [candidate division Zixibacteria bacterium]|nr:Gfo/Idh/MocA family oxidoreductase [candidate division Zixibacteria bacterium]
MTHYKAAIIGCGMIGSMCDSPEDENIISHAHAYHAHKHFDISCCCDINSQSIVNFKMKWGKHIRAYSDVEELLRNENIDVVSIASSTETHAEILYKVLTKESVRLVICEKPFVSTLDELDTIKNIIKMHPEKILLINYSRRYDPGFQKLADMIIGNELGKTIAFNAAFTKGLYHNGCHMLELIERLFGSIKKVTANDSAVIDDDLYGCYFIETQQCVGHITNLVTYGYSLFEMDILFENGRIRIGNSGHRLEIHKPKEAAFYKGYSFLYPAFKIEDSLNTSMLHTIEIGRQLLEDKHLKNNEIFESHLALSEKLLILKNNLMSGAVTTSFEQIGKAKDNEYVGDSWRTESPQETISSL